MLVILGIAVVGEHHEGTCTYCDVHTIRRSCQAINRIDEGLYLDTAVYAVTVHAVPPILSHQYLEMRRYPLVQVDIWYLISRHLEVVVWRKRVRRDGEATNNFDFPPDSISMPHCPLSF